MPTIGTKGLGEAVRIAQTSLPTKLMMFGDSIMKNGADELFGCIARGWPVATFGGIGITGSSQYMLTYGVLSQTFLTGGAAAPQKGKIATSDVTSTVPGYDYANYSPTVATECKMNGTDVGAPANTLSNRIVYFDFSAATQASTTCRGPKNTGMFHKGRPLYDVLNGGGELVFRVYFYDGPFGVTTGDGKGLPFLQVTSGLTLIAASDGFATYAEQPGIVSREITIPASAAASFPTGLAMCVRMAQGTTIDTETVVVLGAELVRAVPAGLTIHMLSALASANPSHYVADNKFSEACWDYLNVAGFTHTLICLNANGGETDAQHDANMRELIRRIRAKAPDMKFILVGIYDLADTGANSVASRTAIDYAIAQEQGHLWLGLADYMPVKATMYGDVPASIWATGTNFLEGQVTQSASLRYFTTMNAKVNSTTDPGTGDASGKESAVVIDTGDDTTAFSGTLTRLTVVPGTVVIASTGKTPLTDPAGDGVLTDGGTGSGTVNYLTGAVAGDFATAVSAGVNITATYEHYKSTDTFCELFTVEPNEILQYTIGGARNFMFGDTAHLNRTRGSIAQAMALWALMAKAAASSGVVIGSTGRFYNG